VFDTLTPAERHALAAKLSRAGSAFCESAMAIGTTVLYLEEVGRIEVLSDAWNGLWNLRQPLVDAMDEMHALMAEADAFAAVRNA
jgi:hypothetical protein